eukprot:2601039-Rhodomonas_salina.3
MTYSEDRASFSRIGKSCRGCTWRFKHHSTRRSFLLAKQALHLSTQGIRIDGTTVTISQYAVTHEDMRRE